MFLVIIRHTLFVQNLLFANLYNALLDVILVRNIDILLAIYMNKLLVINTNTIHVRDLDAILVINIGVILAKDQDLVNKFVKDLVRKDMFHVKYQNVDTFILHYMIYHLLMLVDMVTVVEELL